MISIIKDLIYLAVIVFVINFCVGYYKESKVSFDVPDVQNVDLPVVDDELSKNYDENNYENTQTESYSENSSASNESDYVIYLHGIGDYSQSDILTVKNSLEKFYPVKCVISESLETTYDLYLPGTNSLNAIQVLLLGSDYPYLTHKYHMFVTNEPIALKTNVDNLISGHAFLNGTYSLVSTYEMTQVGTYSIESMFHVSTHEFAHNLGLDHCDNSECLMVPMGLRNQNFCESCQNKIDNLF